VIRRTWKTTSDMRSTGGSSVRSHGCRKARAHLHRRIRKDIGFSFADFDAMIPPREEWPTLQDILQSHNEVDAKYTLTPRLWEYLQDYRAKHEKAGNGFGYSLFGPGDVARTLSARYHKDGSEILIGQELRARAA
jgi:DNA (cytosine-5)-methyltransferase 1